MTIRLAGVALAAIVGACAVGGGAQRAEASTISFYIGYEQDNVSPPTTSGDTYNSFVYINGSINLDGPGAIYHVRIDAYNSNVGPDFHVDYDFYTYKPSLEISQQSGFQDIFYNDGTLSFSAELDLGNLLTNVSGSYVPFGTRSGGPGEASISPVSFVPLPASLPMFAAALVALGGACFSRRHRMATA